MDINANLGAVTLYLDGGNTGGIEGLFQKLADLVVFDDQIADLIFSGIPSGVPVLDDADAQAMRINFLSHNSASFP